MNENDIQQCVNLLKKLKPGFLPLPIFEQVARLVRLPIVDVVPVKKEAGRLMIGCLKRPDDDLWWPNAWHIPGTIFRSTDSLKTAQQRLLNEEIKAADYGKIVFVDFLVHQSERGTEVILIHMVENCILADDSPITWFTVDDLPKNMIESEKRVIDKLLANNGKTPR